MTTEFLRLHPLYAGSWFARAGDTHSIDLIGPRSIPILQDWEDGAFDWQAEPEPVYDLRPRGEEAGAWWMEHRYDTWRIGLTPGAVVWVRHTKKTPRGDTMQGRSKGIWRIGEAEIGPARLRLTLSDRIGDVH
ncbi:MAG: hypothetical protein ACU0DK_15125 [Pseudooceanicola sp.]